MKLFLAMLFSTLMTSSFANAKSYTGEGVEFPQDEAVSVDAEITEVSEEDGEIDELIVVESEDDYLSWLEVSEEESAETVFVDEDGNEYFIESVEEANGSAEKSVKLKKKTKKAKKGKGRNCAAVSGGASWYGPGFHGRKTANGERFDQNALTAAHKTLKFGSKVRVTYKGRSVVVRINDAGPYAGGRVIDLSKAAAASIGLIGPGHGHVTLEVLSCG